MGRPRTTNKHLPKYVSVIHGAYWYRPPGQKPTRIAEAGDESAVWRFMAQHAPSLSSAKMTTMADLFDRYQREIVPTLAPRTQKDYARHLDLLRRTFGHMRPEEIKPRDVGAFLDRPKGKIQANRQVAVLASVFQKAVGRWYMTDKNPCRDVERNPSKRRTRYVTDAEYAAFYEIVPPRMKLAMDLALSTGQRQGDLLALHWKQVDDGYIQFKQSKTGKKLAMRISPHLDAILRRARLMAPQLPREYVIRTRRGIPYTGEGFRAIWQRSMRKALARGIIKERFTFHDLRAKNISDTSNIQEAFERAGHTSMAMTRGTYDRGTRKVEPLK